ncbi:hypothetical protein DHD80_07455 [Gramella sp. AN32]|nr:hypothetical protein [Gramella sp. AN32]
MKNGGKKHKKIKKLPPELIIPTLDKRVSYWVKMIILVTNSLYLRFLTAKETNERPPKARG